MNQHMNNTDYVRLILDTRPPPSGTPTASGILTSTTSAKLWKGRNSRSIARRPASSWLYKSNGERPPWSRPSSSWSPGASKGEAHPSPGGAGHPYELTQKPVKNINIRVHADGSVRVSAGPWVSPAVDAALRQRSAFPPSGAGPVRRPSPLRPKGPHLRSRGNGLPVGQALSLRLQPGPKVEVRQTPSHLLLTLPDPEDPQRRVQAMEAFLKQTCLTVTTQLCRQYQPQLAPLGCQCQRFACGL